MTLDISASGLRLASIRQQVTANNVANLDTPGFRASRVQATEADGGGVRLGGIKQDPAPGGAVPASLPGETPLEGSNVDLTSEAVGLIQNRTLFEANADAFRAQADLLGELLDLEG